jgi:glycosyltransferase involved in cell wall biosynthesis
MGSNERLRTGTGLQHGLIACDGKSRPQRRRWAINGDFTILEATGVARYADEVSRAMGLLTAEGHPLTRDVDLELITPRECECEGIPVRVVPEFRHPRLPQFWVQCQLPWYVRGGLISFCNLAPVTIRKQIACIHDLHTRIMPESYSFLFRAAHRVVLPVIGRRAFRITTVSQLTKGHLQDFGIVDSERIEVSYNGSDHTERWHAGNTKLNLHSTRPFALCLGRRQKYKNLALILRLAPKLEAAGMDLWVAGEIPEEESAALRSYSNTRLLGRIDDDDFAAALKSALCFLFPSRIEGFGLPAIEAMACGCPVVASTAPCMPEVCGQAALYSAPDDPEGWMTHILRLRSDPELREALIGLGRQQAKRYSWRRIAELYFRLMASADLTSLDKIAMQ